MSRKSGPRDEDLQKYFRLASTYKSKFLQLRDAYLELEADNEKLSNVLAETQDKMLTRVNELKNELAELQLIKERLDSDLKIKLTAEQEAHLRIEGKLKREISQLEAKHQEELSRVKTSTHESCDQEMRALEKKLSAVEADLKLTRQNLNKSLTNYEMALASVKEKESERELLKTKLDKCLFVLRYVEMSIFGDQPEDSPFRAFLADLNAGMAAENGGFNWLVDAEDCLDNDSCPVSGEIIKHLKSMLTETCSSQSYAGDYELEQSQSIRRILELTEELDLVTSAFTKSQDENERIKAEFETKLDDLECKLKEASRVTISEEIKESTESIQDQEMQILRGKLELCESENLSLISKLKATQVDHERAVKSLRSQFQTELNGLTNQIDELMKQSTAQQERLDTKSELEEQTKRVRLEMEMKIREEQERFIKMLSDKDEYYEMVIGELESKLQKQSFTTAPSDLNNNSEKSMYNNTVDQASETAPFDAKLEELEKEIGRLNDLLEERENMIEILQVKMDNNELEMNKKLNESQKSIEHLRESQNKLLNELEKSRASPSTNLSRAVSSSFQSISLMSDGKYLEATEIDYLKRIILGYMTGNDRLTMAKVIAAVLKFSDDERNQVINLEKSSQSSFWF